MPGAQHIQPNPIFEGKTFLHGEWVNLSQDNPEPSSVREAMASSNKSKWREAMKKEMESLYKNKVWDNPEPSSVREAMASSNKSKWREAMKKEMESLYKNKVWDLVETWFGL